MPTYISFERTPASGGGNVASRLLVSLVGRISAQPDRPCGPPLSPRLWRGSPCGSIRARGARNVRDWITNRYGLQGRGCGRIVIIARASPNGARQAEGKASRGAGGRLRNAGQRAGAVHTLAVWAAQPSTGGRGNHGISSTTPVCGQRTASPGPNRGGHDSFGFFSTEYTQILISNVPKSCRSLVRTACRTRGGLTVYGYNSDMRKAWRVVAVNRQAPTPQGSRRVATRGWFGADFF